MKSAVPSTYVIDWAVSALFSASAVGVDGEDAVVNGLIVNAKCIFLPSCFTCVRVRGMVMGGVGGRDMGRVFSSCCSGWKGTARV